MKKEIWIILVIFFVLTLLFHSKEFIEYPIKHIDNLLNSTVYGLGYIHPLIFTLFIYIISLIPRGVYKLFAKEKNENEI